MTDLKKTIIRGGLETLYFSGAHVFLRPFVAGVGAILTLHHVRPPRPERFQPNRLLEVTPAFLEDVVRYLRRGGIDIVGLDEMYRRLTEQDFRRRFVCITIDDGYRDTLQWAYPILKKHAVPFCVYIPTSFPDRLGELWWLALEAVVARNARIKLMIDGREQAFDCASVADKNHVFGELYGWVRSFKTEDELRNVVRDLSARYRRRHRGILRRTLHDLGGTGPACRRSARDHRRPHRQPRHAGQGAGTDGALRDADEPVGDRGGARPAARAPVLSGRRSDLGGPRANSASPPNSASRPGSQPGRACCFRNTAII